MENILGSLLDSLYLLAAQEDCTSFDVHKNFD